MIDDIQKQSGKLALAARLRRETTLTITEIAQRLQMGMSIETSMVHDHAEPVREYERIPLAITAAWRGKNAMENWSRPDRRSKTGCRRRYW
jgi:hypothetical protein